MVHFLVSLLLFYFTQNIKLENFTQIGQYLLDYNTVFMFAVHSQFIVVILEELGSKAVCNGDRQAAEAGRAQMTSDSITRGGGAIAPGSRRRV